MKIKKQFVQNAFNERGMTLVEVLASTIIISIILVTFLMIFGQTARTNIASETIIDSTYIAQSEMEKIYGLSKSISSSNKSSAFPSSQFEPPLPKTVEGTNWIEYKKKDNPPGTQIRIRIEDTPEKMSRVIIEVYEGSKLNPSAKMENVLIWEGPSK